MTINVDKGSHSVDLDDFWNGNAQDMNGGKLVEYEIKVTSEGGEDSMTFDDIMNREVDTAFVRIMKFSQPMIGDKDLHRNHCGNDCRNGRTKCRITISQTTTSPVLLQNQLLLIGCNSVVKFGSNMSIYLQRNYCG